MTLLWTIVIGFVVGLVARFLTPGRDPMGFVITTVLGIVGAVLAQFLGQALGLYLPGEPAGFFGAVLGAMIILIIARTVADRRRVV
jgi:uncharacterized membrane protein YeaQ/YmgE (transglycosylase-associated protein family)